MERCKHGMVKGWCSLCLGMEQTDKPSDRMPHWMRSDKSFWTMWGMASNNRAKGDNRPSSMEGTSQSWPY